MPSLNDYLAEGSRIYFSSLKNTLYHKKYPGTAKQICQQIIKDCWNGEYFQISTNNFSQFWTRDFGFCTASLLSLGYEKEVHKTLKYALNSFKEAGKITTTINPKNKTYDFPYPAVDSLPWLIHSIRISKFNYSQYTQFLNEEIKKYFEYFIEKKSGLVKPELAVSSIKDFAIRKSSCYDNCLVGLLARDLAELKLINPFTSYDYNSIIERHFWDGQFYCDDLGHKDYVAGDANLFPFYVGFCRDKERLKSIIIKISEAKLDQPLPLKYTNSRQNIKFIPLELLFRNYESHSIWTHMGPLYIKLVQSVDKELAKKYKNEYKQLIEKQKNYPEVLNQHGRAFGSLVYHCDFGMIWAANYLML
ncbi:hypothetical protein J4437_00745 [Candidatus Woesearchaeota archaeon]|nr:hypothetical protein [Candidatus Woesearchaeota archaeon]